MMKKMWSMFLVLSVLSNQSAYAMLGDPFSLNKNSLPFDVAFGDEKETELKALKSGLVDLEKTEQKAQETITVLQNQLVIDITATENQQRTEGENDFTNKKILLLRSYNQDLATTKSLWKELLGIVKEHIALLEALVKEQSPNNNEGALEKKSFYTIQDLQVLTEQIAALDDKINDLKNKETQNRIDLDNKKKQLTLSERIVREKVKEQAAFPDGKNDNSPFDIHQQAELLDIEVRLKKQEKELNSLRVQEKIAQQNITSSKLYIEEKKQTALKKKRDAMVKMSFRVDKKDVDAARLDLEKKKRNYLTVTDGYLKLIEKKLAEQSVLKESLKERVQKDQKIISSATLRFDEWNGQPLTVEDFIVFVEVGFLNDKNVLLGLEIELLHTLVDFEQSRYQADDTTAAIILTWYKIKHQLFKNSEELVAEIKDYERQVAELERERAAYEDKRRASLSSLELINKSRINLKDLIAKFENQRTILFAHADQQKYLRIKMGFDEVQKQLNNEIELTSKLTENYSKILVALNGMVRQINAMLIELQRVSLWQRSGGAISRDGLANSIPDIFTFFDDFRLLTKEYIGGFTPSFFWNSFVYNIRRPFELFIFILKLLLLIVIFGLIRTYIPEIARLLFKISKESPGQYTLSRFIGALLLFIAQHYILFFVWMLCLILVITHTGSDIYLSILFYLFSIPLLMLIAYRLIHYVGQFNVHHEHIFFSRTFQKHVLKIAHFFLFSTIAILCFREAFILGSYTKSELPDILLAVYGVIVRVLLLALPRKEDLLNALPTKTPFFARLWRVIDRYYTVLFLISVLFIVMSDPHVGGYNNLIFYLLWGVIGTVIIIRLLFSFYMFCRRSSATILFFSDGESLRERFSFAKTLYGISIIFLFVAFLCAGFLLIAWLWGKPVSFTVLSDFFAVERLTIDMGNGVYHKLTLLGLIGVFSIIPLAFFVGFIVDRFVLYRIFSVLLVNPGVHNAVSTISYYVTVITVITLGLWHQGLGFLILYYVGPLLFGMAWALRDLFNDFVSYFIILINRPIKVGDYIKITDDVQGAVRSITPRSVVLRRNRGFCVIVPNHKIIQEVIVNWDYHLSYICCPDIVVTVAYEHNPDEVFKILQKAAEENNNVLRTPAPLVRLELFEDWGFQFLVRCYISPEKTLEQWDIASSVRLNITRKLRENGMDLAVPVRIIHERLSQKK